MTAHRFSALIIGLPTLLVTTLVPALAQPATTPENWIKPLTPHRIVGNIYYVGTYDLACFLFTTPAGHILINTGVKDSAPIIKKSVEELGFNFSDIKLLLTTQGHFDHVAAMAEVRRMTRARLLASAGDTPAIEDGGRSDFMFGPNGYFEPAKVDGQIADGQRIVLGGFVLTAHIHAGHTPGALSYTASVTEGSKTYRVLIANMPSMNPGTILVGNKKYPSIAIDFARSLAQLKVMPVDVFLSSHGQHYGLLDKYSPGAPYDPDRFVDPQGFRTRIENYEKAFREELARQQQ